MLDNFTETILSDNRPIMIEEYKDTITRGATCTHIFNLPFPFAGYVQDLVVIYKQGLEIVLIKDFSDCEVEENADGSIVTIILSPVDTLKFENNLLTIQVQLKIATLSNETFYSTPITLKLEPTLDN